MTIAEQSTQHRALLTLYCTPMMPTLCATFPSFSGPPLHRLSSEIQRTLEPKVQAAVPQG